ncbi:MAG: acyl-CoA dehydrogenase family protein [Mycobacteriales bacterium]
MDASEKALLTEALAALVGQQPADLTSALREFGWFDLLAEDAGIAVTSLFELQGERLTSSSALDALLCHFWGVEATAVVLPVPPGSAAPGVLHDGHLLIDGVLAGAPSGAAAVATDHGIHLVRVDSLLEPSAGLDLGRGWVRARGSVAVDSRAAAADWPQALRVARLAIASELIGIGRWMLRTGIEHTTSRHQFGRPLASFQVVKHKLADVRLWQEVAELAVASAWEDGDPVSAALAAASAGRFVRTARENVQQVLGGMGFSWEHPFHTYLRRALVLESLLGSAPSLRAEIGAQLLSARRLPALAAL